MAIGHEPIRS